MIDSKGSLTLGASLECRQTSHY